MLRPGLVRFLLACLVICYHLSVSLFFGKFAVGCFFILSGYWISLMYEKKYLLKKMHLKIFYISRLWRLIPAFYTFTVITFIIISAIGINYIDEFKSLSPIESIQTIASYIILLGYANTKLGIIAPAWSLDIELQFYILFPFLAYLVKTNKKYLIWLALTAFLVSIYLTFFSHSWLGNTSLAYLYLFLLGVIIYRFDIRPTHLQCQLSGVALILLVAIQYAFPSLAPLYRNLHSNYYLLLSIVLTLIAIPLLIKSIHTESNKFDRFLGEMSFMIYLSHWAWLIPYNNLIENHGGFFKIICVAGFFTLNFFISYVVYKLVDRPSEKLRHNWLKRQPDAHI